MRRTRRRLVRITAAFLLASALSAAASPAVATNSPPLTGAGSTWSAVAIQQWIADVSHLGLTINYQAVGSSVGRALFIQHAVDFAVSEIPFYGPCNRSGTECYRMQHTGIQYAYLPIVAGGTSLMYNITGTNGQRINNLRLDSHLLALIFTGKITNWDDKQIKSQNPGVALPNQQITVVVRQDGSGTSAQFTAYLNFMQHSLWQSFWKLNGLPGAAASTSYFPLSNFPSSGNIVGQTGSDQLANFVANPSIGSGSIGYVEWAYAKERGFPVVSLKNASGAYTQPTSNNDAIALTHATLNPDLTQNLTHVYTAPEPAAYPMSSYSYMIVQTKGFDPAKGNVLGRFIIYFACTGQKWAAPLGYSPLPKNLVEDDFKIVNQIPGAPNTPAVTPSACPNPTLSSSYHISKGTPAPGTGGGGGTGAQTQSPAAGGAQGTQSPAATASASASYAASASAGSLYSMLPSASYSVYALAASQQIEGAKAPSVLPLLLAAVAVLLLIFGPLFLRIRSRDKIREG